MSGSQITAQDLKDVIITAVEGGIGYWAQTEFWNETLWGDKVPVAHLFKTLKIAEAVDVDSSADEYDWKNPITIDPEKLRAAIRARAQTCGESIRHWIENHDATEADVVVQMATLGEIRYG